MDNDFDEGFIARSPKEWVASMYLSSQSRVVDDLRLYLSATNNSGDKMRAFRSLKASLFSLFSLCSPRISTSKKKDSNAEEIKKLIAEEIKKLILSDKEEDVLEAVDVLFNYLENDLKLTDIANIQNYDRKNVFKSNKISGYN